MASEHTLTLNDGDFEQTVLKSDKPVLVDFWAEWCGPCRMIAPAVEGLAEEYSGRVSVGKLNIDENPNTPMKYGVRSIPTLLLFKDGEVVESTVGVAGKEQLAALLDKHAAQKIA
jgi:thioredoxin 1